MCDLFAPLVPALKNKKGDAAISVAAEKTRKKTSASLANIGNELIPPRSQLGFGTVPGVYLLDGGDRAHSLPTS